MLSCVIAQLLGKKWIVYFNYGCGINIWPLKGVLKCSNFICRLGVPKLH